MNLKRDALGRFQGAVCNFVRGFVQPQKAVQFVFGGPYKDSIGGK